MNLRSCDECGVVLDLDKMNVPDDIYDDEGCIDSAKAEWVDGEFKPIVPCPVCKHSVQCS